MKALLIALMLVVCLFANSEEASHDYIYGGSGLYGSGLYGGGLYGGGSRIIRRTVIRRPIWGSTYSYPRWGGYSRVWKHNEADSQESEQ